MQIRGWGLEGEGPVGDTYTNQGYAPGEGKEGGGTDRYNPNPSIEKCRMEEGGPSTAHHRTRLHSEDTSMTACHLWRRRGKTHSKQDQPKDKEQDHQKQKQKWRDGQNPVEK